MFLKCQNKLDLALELDSKGMPAKFEINKLNWNYFPVELEIKDDLRQRFYRTGSAETVNCSNGEYLHKWSDADFDVLEKWYEQERKIIRWIQVLPHENIAKRSVTIRVLVSFAENVYSLNCWTANEKFPSQIYWVGGQKIYYGDVCYGSLIPGMAIYSEKNNSGLIVGAQPGIERGGRLSFALRDYHSEGMDVEFSHLLLSADHPAEGELFYAPCEGDWRSALAFWRNEFPEFFAAPNPALSRMAGPFLITNPQLANDYLDKAAEEYAPVWAEVHNYFSRYGEYIPADKEFTPITKHDYPQFECADKFNLAMVHEHIAQLHKNNILAMLYLQASGDCFVPYAEKEFPDAIARDSAGHIMPTWENCCFANASPGTSFHKHMQKQIAKFFAEFPDIDGVFLDQLCYQAVDYAHADGKTAADCREASMFGDSYKENLQLIADTLHKENKSLWANGPFCLDIARNIDGMMCEGTGTLAKSFQYLTCGSKGLLIHSYAQTDMDVEYMFRRCLTCGGSWSICGEVAAQRPPELTEKQIKLLKVCGPLTDLLAGCQWVLERNPFTLPAEYEGNLFELPDGNLALTVVSKHDTLLRCDRGFDEPFKVTLRCSQASEIKSATVYGTGSTVDTEKVFAENELTLKVENHRVFSVIILRK